VKSAASVSLINTGTLLRAAGSLLPPEVQFTEYDGSKLLPPFDEEMSPHMRSRSRTGVTPSRRLT
jgi:hypothetical protein